MKYQSATIFRCVAILLFLLSSSVLAATPKPTITSSLNLADVQPGQQAAVAIVLDVGKGFHVQGDAPGDPSLVPYLITADPADHIKVLPTQYAKQESYNDPALGTVYVFENQSISYVPIQIADDVPLGPLTIKLTVRYQMCNAQQCFAPTKLPIEIQTNVVARGQTIAPVKSDLFKGFDASVFAHDAAAKVTTTQSSTPEIFGYKLGNTSYLLAFVGALFVGVIFNVMPCVLPIVPLKAMGFYEVSKHSRSRSMMLGAVFSSGIIATFGVLALLVVVFRVFDWGKLFSETWFVIAIVSLLLIFSLSVFGLFSVALPQSVMQLSPRHDTVTGNFLLGIVTAVLSTPCTFGLFFALLIWAVSQPAVIGVALLMTVGLGMSLPYMVLASFPELARNFPRTGAWANLVKQMMGFLLLGSAVFFARPLMRGINEATYYWLLFGVIAVAGSFLIVRTIQLTHRLRPILITTACTLAIVAMAFAVVQRLNASAGLWKPYSAEALATALDSHRPVLVKFTAAWCTNCHVVEATVFTNPKVLDEVHDKNVVMLKADLTNDDAPGWEKLRELSPVGAIPFTAVYLPGSTEPTELTGIYSASDLLNTLAKNAQLSMR